MPSESKLPRGLPAAAVRRSVRPASLPFRTTATVTPLQRTAGQPRAEEALQFGMAERTKRFHIFVAGPPGSGREAMVVNASQREAASRETPSDWLYVYNFDDPSRPVAIAVPAGQGRVIRNAMDTLLAAAKEEIPAALESEDVQRQRDQILNEANQQRSTLITELQKFAADHSFSVEMTNTGIASTPLVNGQPVTKEAAPQLSDAERQTIEKNAEAVQAQISATMRQLRHLESATGERFRSLEREVVAFVTGQRFEELGESVNENPALRAFVDAVQRDLPEHLHDFVPPSTAPVPGSPDLTAVQREEHLMRYQINVLVDNGDLDGAPVILERNPTYSNLVGHIDYRVVLGSMVTDFRQIKPGAIHLANGGFLVLFMSDLMRNPQSWEALKRALIADEIELDRLADQMSITPVERLRPLPIPIDLKVILIGTAALYQSLMNFDEDFGELFAVRADFAPDMPWMPEHELEYAGFVAQHVATHGLLHFDKSAVARVIEQGGRLRSSQDRLSARFSEIGNLVTESSHWASDRGGEIVTGADVQTAIDKQTWRANLAEERLRHFISSGTIVIATDGSLVGQVNGLAVLDTGSHSFGHPVRVTARVAVGRGAIQSIEREINHDGPIHSKGFLTISGYLMGQYGTAWPITASASITFEQQYEEIDGDSASSTELYALLSALSGIPLRQGLAVTGSVNQYGEIQAVGGVNQKIEGFFAVCRESGLNGRHGVIIPESCRRDLMLHPDLVEAIAKRTFHIWPVSTVDEGIGLMTGVRAGTRKDDGSFTKGSIHALVQERLYQFFESSRAASDHPGQNNNRRTMV